MRKRFLERILPLLGVGASRSLLVSSRRLIRKTSAGAKTILKGGFLTSFGSLLSNNNKNEKETEDAVKEANIDRPKVLEKSEKSSDGINKVLASSIQFSKYAEETTQDVKPIRAIGQELPEIVVNKKYSPIMTDIIENINGIKKRLSLVEKRVHLQTSLLMKLRSASAVMGEKTQEAVDEIRQDNLEEKREKDERNVELKGISNFEKKKNKVYDKVFTKTKDYATGIKDTLVSALQTFAVPAGLLTLGFLSDLASADGADGGTEDNLTSSETLGAGGVGASVAMKLVKSGGRSLRNQSLNAKTEEKNSLKRKNVAKHKQKVRKMKSILSRLKKLPYIGTFAGIASSILIFNSIIAIFDRLSVGELTEDEAEQQIKKQLTILVTDLGGGFLGAYIGGLLGVKIGGSVGMIAGPKGAAVVGLGGFGIGAYVGYKSGIKFLRQSGAVEMVVDALYQYILGNDSTLSRVWTEMTQMTSYSDEELIRQGYSPDMTPAEMIVKSTEQRRITNESGDEVRYKSTASMFGVDEQGILTALTRVKSPEEYYNVKKEVEKTLGEDNFENFLSDNLSKEELAIIIDSMKNAMFANRNLQPKQIGRFFGQISTNPKILEATSPEFFEMIQKGDAVPVILEDGSRTVMSVEEIENALIPDAQKVRMLETATDQKERYQRLLERQVRSGRLITNSVDDDMFINAPEIKTSPTNPQSSVVPIVMPTQTMNGSRTPLNMSKSSAADPGPSSTTSDSFLNVAYTT
jgi:hypothetical protein